jgi:hypothetical protein
MARMQLEAQQLPLPELPAELDSIRIRMANIEDLMAGLKQHIDCFACLKHYHSNDSFVLHETVMVQMRKSEPDLRVEGCKSSRTTMTN